MDDQRGNILNLDDSDEEEPPTAQQVPLTNVVAQPKTPPPQVILFKDKPPAEKPSFADLFSKRAPTASQQPQSQSRQQFAASSEVPPQSQQHTAS